MDVAEVDTDKDLICRDILAALPEWFGLRSAIEDYALEARDLVMLAVGDQRRAVGFVTLKTHFETTVELHAMGVLPEFHRQGLGRRFVDAAAARAGSDGATLLSVKTLSESRPDRAYAGTRAFYRACGFLPLEEFPTYWGPTNPCLVMVKTL